jgi:hypothetical protein
MIGANREATTRALRRLREIGAVEVEGRRIRVAALEALRQAGKGLSMVGFFLRVWLCVMHRGWHAEGLRASCGRRVFGLYLRPVYSKPIRRTAGRGHAQKFISS